MVCVRRIQARLGEVAASSSGVSLELHPSFGLLNKAGRLLLQEIMACVSRRESLCFEITLSGQGYLRHIAQWRNHGYHVSLIFLSLLTVETAVARVAERVRQGGRDIPEAVIRRRFATGRMNFERNYRSAVDARAIYDNSRNEPLFIEWGERS